MNRKEENNNFEESIHISQGETFMKFNTMQQIKRRFFAMRNGVVADTVRRAGSPYKIIFGMLLPQIREVASAFGPSAELAEKLWSDSRTRESMLLAPWILPAGVMDEEMALRWLSDAVSTEAVDVLCMARLRNVGFAHGLFDKLSDMDTALSRYAAMRLFLNNRAADLDSAVKALAEAELTRSDAINRPVALQVIDELNPLY